MDYEKKHKGEVIRATQLWECGDITRENLEYIFPELAVSDDERIRKVLIEYFKSYKEQGTCGAETFNGIPTDNILAWLEKQAPKNKTALDKAIEEEVDAWLEKQDEQRSKLVDFDYNAKDSNLQEVTYFIPNGFHAEMDGNKVVIKRGEQKPAIDFRAEDWCVSKVDGKIHNIYNSGVEPKFKVGDWIVSKWGEIYQIKEVMLGSYNLLCTNNAEEINSITQVDNNSRLLCIGDIKKLEEQGKKKNVDAESSSKTILASHGNPFEKPKWTEEDDYNVQCCIAKAERDIENGYQGRNKELIDWLKSLKQRMGGMNYE